MKKYFNIAILLLVINGCSIEEPVNNAESKNLDVSQQMQKIRSSADKLFYYTWDKQEELTTNEKTDLIEIVGKLKNNFHKLKSIDSSQTSETGFQLILNDQNKLLEDIETNLKEGKFDYARWQLKGVTHNCFSCHSRLPSLQDKFDKNLRIDNTSFESKLAEVEFLVASRQFANAENKLFHLAQDLSAKDYRKGLALDSIKLWILLQLRVTGDLKEAANNLDQLVDESSFDISTKSLISYWSDQLRLISNTGKHEHLTKDSVVTLDSIEGILGDLKKYKTEDENNHDLVSSIYASSLLHQLQYKNESIPDHQKLLALLGISYARITIPSQQALSNPYLVQCIEVAPHTKWSKICFDLWKSNFDFNHTGSGGEKLEGVDVERVRKLRSLGY